MNMISQLRRKVGLIGWATITTDEFNQLQAEWIMRVPASEEIDRLRAKVEALKAESGQSQFCPECNRLAMENAELRKDADRYRWLREANNQTRENSPCVSNDSFGTFFDDDLDAEIDAEIAMKEQA